MTKQRKWFWTGIGGATLTVVVVLAALLLKHEPGFYRQSLRGHGEEGKDLSKNFIGKMAALITCMMDGKGDWEFSLTQDEINSYFEEGFISLGESEALRKHGIHEPRLVCEDNKLRLAFRYGSGLLATVVSYDLRIWLVPRECNTVAIEILGKRAGAIPLSTQSLLDGISDVVRTKGIDVTWYRHDNNPVAIVRFQGERPNRTGRLLRLAVCYGSVEVAGRSGEDPAQPPARPGGEAAPPLSTPTTKD
jgi:hypothetical protein